MSFDFNRLIKEVGALMPSLQVEFTKQITYKRETTFLTKPKYLFLQSHCPRGSFATNESLRGTEIPTIMAITGHKTIKNFLRYVKATGEATAKKLEKSWEKQYKGIG